MLTEHSIGENFDNEVEVKCVPYLGACIHLVRMNEFGSKCNDTLNGPAECERKE
jgi:hypothetical protein